MSLLLLAVLAPLAAGESLFLQSGDEYDGTIVGTAGGQVRMLVGGEERVFPLAEVQRIELQRPRDFDDAETAADLAKAAPFFDQVLKPTSQELVRQFPQADAVVLADYTRVSLSRGGRYEVARLQAWRILRQSGADLASRSILYFPDRQKVAVRFGLTVLPDGSVARLDDAAVKDEALYTRTPAYNFLHRYRFTLKGAVPGATLLLSTTLTGRGSRLEPLALDEAFWGTEPALDRAVWIEPPGGRGARLAFEATGGLGTPGSAGWLRWEARDTPQIVREPMMPPLADFSPRLVLAWPRATWADIAEDFLERAGGDVVLPTRGVPPNGLFDHVRTKIRLEDVPLDALPDGPARPETVLNRGYGTEVERALLLAALLRGAACKAETVLVRGRDEGPLVGAVPRLDGFDRAVVRMTRPNGQVEWLQADHEDRGFGELAPEVQGAQGLDLETGQIVTLPILPPSQESLTRTVDVEIAPDGSAQVRDSYAVTGHYARAYRGLKSLSEAEFKQWAARFVGGDVTGVDLVDVTRSDFTRANAEERLTFVYRVPALAETAGNFLLLRLPNASASAVDVGRSTRERDLFWTGRELEDVTFAVRAPAGYKVYALGDGVEAKGDGWSGAARFQADKDFPNVVRFHDAWERTALGAPKAAYAAYREARIRRSRLRDEVLVFVKE